MCNSYGQANPNHHPGGYSTRGFTIPGLKPMLLAGGQLLDTLAIDVSND